MSLGIKVDSELVAMTEFGREFQVVGVVSGAVKCTSEEISLVEGHR